MEIHKKILQEHFDALVSGEKTFELRLNDEDLKEAKSGDILVLEEWDSVSPDRKPTGREIRKTISHASRFTIGDLAKWWPRDEMEEKGLVIFSLKDPT